MKRLILALTIAAMGLFYSGAAGAFTQTTTGSMNIAATVLPRCTVTTIPMEFPPYDGTRFAHATSTITVNCSTGVQYRIDIDKGLNTIGTTTNPRYVKTGTSFPSMLNTIPYGLYKTNTYMVMDAWGDNGTTYCLACTIPPTGLTATGTGLDQPATVYGELLSSTNPAGTYTDTVIVTVNY